jgi:hypothetical protein
MSNQTDAGRQGLRRFIWIIVGFLVVLGGCGLFIITLFRGILNRPPTTTPRVTSQQSIVNTQTMPVATQSVTLAVKPDITATLTSAPPTDTSVPTVSPTAIPLPIIEDFKKPMSKLWQITGDPILTTTNTSMDYDGVLTTSKGQYASIAIGNTAWSDYVIHIRAFNEVGNIFLGFRVKDLNNMLAIECEAWNCNWVVIENGAKEIISETRDIWFYDDFTLNVVNENLNGVSHYGGGLPDRFPFLVLPPKYQGKFLNGGIYIRFMDVEIDDIKIFPP